MYSDHFFNTYPESTLQRSTEERTRLYVSSFPDFIWSCRLH
ncbi:hypothetical protein DGo_PB0055 (plasmid) [Deinococcus gobiensis I-0]|uniref:Uncharacterized protein n=1 Tax=Deinococcus gobiensis (strain DSM 21396 / JCM 16679 / CGMCC 1.7299 / I-0) TaxID=745776 RepID=H8H1C7_DEIGI|nr:hypothetical protein DGo_PB0055 [Deinococcus gobiensis I-0]